MDYFGVVREAWDVVRRERGLWGLGAIELLRHLTLWALIAVVAVPMVMLSMVAAASRDSVAMSVFGDGLAFWLASRYVGLLALLVAVFLAYTAAAVLSLAAQAGIVSETAKALDGERPSATAGLAVGFKRWWRAAAILALPALPSLLYALILAIVVRSLVAAPLAAGERLDFVQLQGVMSGLSPVSWVVGLVALPLGVLAAVALRIAIIEDIEWREAFKGAWEFCREHFSHVALMFLVLYLVAFAATLVAELAVGIIGGVLGVGAVLVGTSAGLEAGVAVGAVAIVVLLVLFGMFMAGLGLVSSISWTIMWSRLRPPGQSPAIVAASAVSLSTGPRQEETQ